MKRILTDIHTHLRTSRKHGGPPAPANVLNTKRYDRFPLLTLPPLAALSVPLGDVLLKRMSRGSASVKLNTALIAELLGHSLSLHGEHRPYPSGGALYPVEVYALPYRVEGLERSSYHYRPDTHALERMFPLKSPTSTDILTGEHADYPLVLVLTSLWARSHTKYHDFALELALMEAGHIMQNLQLVGTALSLSTCPMGGFNDVAIGNLLHLDVSRESVLCTFVIGESVSISSQE